jgi:hypothetical protein
LIYHNTKIRLLRVSNEPHAGDFSSLFLVVLTIKLPHSFF